MKGKFIFLLLYAALFIAGVYWLFDFRNQSQFEYIPQPNLNALYDTTESPWRALHSPYTRTDSLFAEGLLHNVIQCHAQDADFIKHQKIANYLIEQLAPYHGEPPSWLFDLSVSEQLEAIRNNQTEVFCTQYSALYTFLARCAGLTVRRIEAMGKNDRHAIQETYDRQQQCWIFSDLLNEVVAVYHNNKPIHCVDLLTFLRKNETEQLTILGRASKMLLFQTYEEAARFDFDDQVILHFYHEQNLPWLYSDEQRLHRFLTLDNWFERYAETPMSNWKAYLKYVLFALIFFVGFQTVYRFYSLFLVEKKAPLN